jgi:hypothetical protein
MGEDRTGPDRTGQHRTRDRVRRPAARRRRRDRGRRGDLPPVGMCELDIFRVLRHHPPPAKALHDLLAGMISHGRLDSRFRELFVMRVGWQTGSVHEWARH